MPHQDIRQNIVKRGSIRDLYGLFTVRENVRKRSAEKNIWTEEVRSEQSGTLFCTTANFVIYTGRPMLLGHETPEGYNELEMWLVRGGTKCENFPFGRWASRK